VVLRKGMWVVFGLQVGIVVRVRPDVRVDVVDGPLGVTVRPGVRVRAGDCRQARRGEIPPARLAGVSPGLLDFLGYKD
jgi:hypothetical protein